MNPLDTPLSPAELDELETFLDSDDAPESTMDVSTLEGFFTAIVIGPQMVPPSHWLPWVWDMESGKTEVSFASLEQANRIMGLLLRMMNGIADAFVRDPAAFEPMYWREVQWGAAEWCEGFLLGTQFADAWSLLWVARPSLVTPFLRLGTDEGIEFMRKAGDAQDWMEAVAPALVEIHAFWKARRTDAPPVGVSQVKSRRTPVLSDAPKVGRNDACPCGSGMKFKKCCGASGSTWH